MSAQPVTLREIDKDNVVAVLKTEVAPGQERFVASNAVSISQAHYSDVAWFRAVYAGDEVVGFVLLAERSDEPDENEPYLWRFMIGVDHQRKGYGRAALGLAIEHARTIDGSTAMMTSVVEGDGSPLEFYLGYGFENTGRYDDDELVLRYDFAANA